MRSHQIFPRITIAVVVLASSAVAFGQNAWTFPDFSATQVFESRKANMSMKVYRSGSSVRVQRSDALSTLYVPSVKRVYNFTTYPDQSHQCVVMKPEQAKMLPSPLELLEGPDVKRTVIGSEMMEGHLCTMEKVVVARPDGSKIESKVWEAQDLKGIPVRIESHIGEVTLSAVYRDILVGTPEETFFSVPNRCTPFEKMGEVAERKTIP